MDDSVRRSGVTGTTCQPRAQRNTAAPHRLGDRARTDPGKLPPQAVAGAFELRGALRAGRVWLDHSHRHTDPATHLHPDNRWHAPRGDFMQAVGQPNEQATGWRNSAPSRASG